jgi:YqcI/YcgG family
VTKIVGFLSQTNTFFGNKIFCNFRCSVSRMDSFKKLVESTSCPYAATAKVHFGPPWHKDKSFEDNIQRIAIDLAEFCEFAFRKKYHGYVVNLNLGTSVQDFSVVKKTFCRFLFGLNSRDSQASNCMQKQFLSRDWQFEFAGVKLFANVFAPCYSINHTKYVESTEEMFVFFQPEFSFDFCGINPKNRHTKEYIRHIFAEHGKPYDGELIDQRIEALLYMFPKRLGDDPVYWWEEENNL